MAVFVVKNTRH